MARRKLTDEQKSKRIEKRSSARQAAKAKAEELQQWFTEKKEERDKKVAAVREERDSKSKGAYRVPQHLRGDQRNYRSVSDSTTNENYAARRQMGKMQRIRPVRAARETIFHKKDSEGNLTTEKVDVEATRGPVSKIETPRGNHVPYENRERDAIREARRQKRNS